MNPHHPKGLNALAALKGSRDRKVLGTILDAVNSGIIILDQYENMAFSNARARRLLDMEADQIPGRHVSRIFMPEDRRILVPNILEVARSTGEFQGEVMLRTGRSGCFLALFSCCYWIQDGEKLFVITFNDISALKRVERMLERSERMVYLGRMLDDISHQIRNPVLAIGGFSRRLLKSRLEKPEYVHVILDESRRLEMLLDVLTEFIQLPKPRFSMETNETIRDLSAGMARDITSQFDVELRVQSQDTNASCLVITDKVLFSRALEPVVVNACEAFLESGRKPVVMLKFNSPLTDEGGMEIEIADNGPGIRPPLLPRIFHPFFSTKTGHLGMGLTFTRQIMDELGGSVEAESRVDAGTTVRVRLPGDRRRHVRTRLLNRETRILDLESEE